MTQVKVATWNVNSLRVRLPHVFDWLKAEKPDLLALQETKLQDADFPVEAIEDAGYTPLFSGQRTYNGVAFLAKRNLSDPVTDLPGLEDPQRRVLAATMEMGKICIRVINFYVPNGESVESEKFVYKMNWLAKARAFLESELKQYPHLLVFGDFNIARETIDVHDPKAWAGHVLFSAKERTALQHWLDLGLHDCFRAQHPETKAYSWWDYRLNAFKRNLGLRIDYILASDVMQQRLTDCHIDKTPRALERPSDHTPVVAVFAI